MRGGGECLEGPGAERGGGELVANGGREFWVWAQPDERRGQILGRAVYGERRV